jgi:hypothetical protein
MRSKKLGIEYPDKNEDDITRDIIQIISKSLEKDYENKRHLKRFHAKSHGLLKAVLSIDGTLPRELQVGLFKLNKTYEAWIRFSNASSNMGRDDKKGARGMSIKIMNVGEPPLESDKLGNTQDILLTNNKIFFPGTAKMMVAAMKIFFGNFFQKIFNSLYILFSFQLGRLIFFSKGQIRPANLLELHYTSATPYLFGPGKSIKWHVKPLKTGNSTIGKERDMNFLRKRLIEDVGKRAYDFSLYIQQQRNPIKQPIEDASIEWKSPLIRVGTIRILRQEFDMAARNDLDSEITFSPWHSMQDHRPLGGVNRIRRNIYGTLSKLRADHNKGI